MKAIKSNMKDQLLTNDRAIMYCKYCKAEFSANAGDYWDYPGNYTFTHCFGKPMELVRKYTVIESI